MLQRADPVGDTATGVGAGTGYGAGDCAHGLPKRVTGQCRMLSEMQASEASLFPAHVGMNRGCGACRCGVLSV